MTWPGAPLIFLPFSAVRDANTKEDICFLTSTKIGSFPASLTSDLTVRGAGRRARRSRSPVSMASGELPYYIFVSNSSLLSTTQAAPSSLLLHPSIQYHYQDDSPLELFPRSEDEHILVLDYDPSGLSQPSAKSISNNIAVTSLKVADAPGAASSGSGELPSTNDKMYIIHTSTLSAGASYVLLPITIPKTRIDIRQGNRRCFCTPRDPVQVQSTVGMLFVVMLQKQVSLALLRNAVIRKCIESAIPQGHSPSETISPPIKSPTPSLQTAGLGQAPTT